MRVDRILPGALHLAWPHLWPMLEPAAARSHQTEADVLPVIVRGEADLWGIAQGNRPIAAVTTQLTQIGERGCRLWLVGGSRMDEWVQDFLWAVEPWAQAHGCAHVWGTQSRKGWRRIVRAFGGEQIEVAGHGPSWMRRL